MIVEGANAVIEYIKSEKKMTLIEIYENIKHSRKIQIEELAEKKGITIQYVKKRSKNQDGITAIVDEELKLMEFEVFVHESISKNKSIVLILDQVQDPRNLGAIIRSADAFGVDIIILPEHGRARVTETTIKTSTGAISHIPICYVNNLSQAIEKLKKVGYWVYSIDTEGSKTYLEEKYSFKSVILLGSEGFGIRKKVQEKADFTVTIPMSGNVNSLNVSVATGIILSAVHEKIK
ncbi:MAG: 23S rRNA (guanosine(2251)-2'-O)-methyltransferase RlmB [Fusobacteria bacterium]|nr:23S rRNA (guanosine(2251)-2'-O)-methyltransferase RlmB [Fusobacteriota bacterium]